MIAHIQELAVHQAGSLMDGCGRCIDHLRLSVTSRCDQACLYCRPRGDIGFRDVSVLSDAQRVELVQFLRSRYGLQQVRITGGEPLIHPTVTDLIADLRGAMQDISIAMTTNAQRLASLAGPLREAGLQRLNVSLDSLQPDRYHRLTGGSLERVLAGLDAADEAGFCPPKINMVVLRGINDDEVISMVDWAIDRGLEIRFLEAMPIGSTAEFNRARFVSTTAVRRQLATRFELSAIERGHGETAQRYRAVSNHGEGIIGFISPISESFCSACRRVRVTADGKFYPCLLDSRFADLTLAWNNRRLQAELADRLIRSAVAEKEAQGPQHQAAGMITLGG